MSKIQSFEFLQRNKDQIAAITEDVFMQAANDSERRDELDSFVNSISNPGVRSALVMAIGWLSARVYIEREKAAAKNRRGQ